MRCSKARRFMSDYVDGNLSANKSLRLKQHLQSCSDCLELLKDFQKIARDASTLEAPMPSEGVWFKIKAKLLEEPQKGKAQAFGKMGLFSFFARQTKPRLAFSLVLISLIIGGVILGLYYWREEVTKEEDLQKLAIAHLVEAEHHYQLAIEALNQAISQEKMELNPQLTAVFKKNLEIIDSSIVACNLAIQQQPDNLEARSYLLTAYKEKIALLNEIMKRKTESL